MDDGSLVAVYDFRGFEASGLLFKRSLLTKYAINKRRFHEYNIYKKFPVALNLGLVGEFYADGNFTLVILV